MVAMLVLLLSLYTAGVVQGRLGGHDSPGLDCLVGICGDCWARGWQGAAQNGIWLKAFKNK